jgi:glycosyltransferase involved in cell wall biosynthesis
MITVCITSYNTLPFLQLAVRSLRRYCQSWVKVWIWDNGSTDGSVEWGMANSDAIFFGSNTEHGHGGAMDAMGKQVLTDYVAFVDSDVEFTGDPFGAAIRHLQLHPTSFACDGGFYDVSGRVITLPWNGEQVVQMPRIDPCCAVLDTHRLHQLLRSESSWKPIQRGDCWYDVGATLHEDVIQAGWHTHRHSAIKQCVHHFGNSTWPANGCHDPEVLRRVAANRTNVIEKLSRQ